MTDIANRAKKEASHAAEDQKKRLEALVKARTAAAASENPAINVETTAAGELQMVDAPGKFDVPRLNPFRLRLERP